MPEPKPLDFETPFEEYSFKRKRCRNLMVPRSWPGRAAVEVLETRSTQRDFAPLDHESLDALLWFGARTKEAWMLPSGFMRQHRAAPSAGGRHPLHVLVISPCLSGESVQLYNPKTHALSVLGEVAADAGDALLQFARQVVPTDDATLIWLVGEPARTLTRYASGESLVWRDAGVLLATLSFAAEALGLVTCCLGATGEDWVTATFNSNKLLGAGGCWVGSAVSKKKCVDETI